MALSMALPAGERKHIFTIREPVQEFERKIIQVLLFRKSETPACYLHQLGEFISSA